MQSNFLKLFFIVLTVSFLSSCLDTTNTATTTSSDPSFVSLKLAGNDSVKNAVFTLDATGKTIINIDSLPFRTRIDSVNPTFSFKSTIAAFLHLTLDQGFKFTKGKKDSVAVTGKDTVDFRQPLLKISNFASDGKSYIKYNIQVNVHTVQPELYVWSKMKDNISSVIASSQKAILLNDKIYYYLNDGSSVSLFSSADGYSSSVATTGLPVATPLNDMILFNGNLFVSRDGLNIYSSTNGTNWTKKTVSEFTFSSLLCVWNGKLWAVVQSVTDATYHFATSPDGTVWTMIGKIPDNFPVTDFSAITITTVTNLQKVLVLGGYSPTGSLLKNYWSSEDGVYWYDFSDSKTNARWTAKNNLDSLAVGACVISYDKKLLLFGKYKTLNQTFYRESTDEGLSWQVPDLTYNQIRQSIIIRNFNNTKDSTTYNYYQPHTYQSVVVDNNNRIFIIGGKTISANSTDIWTGKLNRKSFLRQ